jgi:GNAT superfamily N-acetyltransferase
VQAQEAIHLSSGYRPGCIGRITELHARYYTAKAGFGAAFEAQVARELAEFCVRYIQDRDGLWLAGDGDRIEGSIAIDGAGSAEHGAHLRWFIVADGARGRGVGAALLGAALAFCRARVYRRVYLWTFAGLDVARHLYEKNGFRLACSQRGCRWGTEVEEQLFTRGDV